MIRSSSVFDLLALGSPSPPEGTSPHWPPTGLGPSEPAVRLVHPLTTASTTLCLVRGRPVVTKKRVAVDPWRGADLAQPALAEARRATKAEAGWLAEARHGGVIRLRRVCVDQAWFETDLAGLHSLRTALLAPTAVTAALATTATTLAELHRRGLTHGNLALEHVIVNPTRVSAAVLCSPTARQTSHQGPQVDLDRLVAMVAAVGPPEGAGARRWARLVADLGAVADLDEAARLLSRASRWRGRSLRTPWNGPTRCAEPG